MVIYLDQLLGGAWYLYLNQLSGAFHTHISYHDTDIKKVKSSVDLIIFT